MTDTETITVSKADIKDEMITGIKDGITVGTTVIAAKADTKDKADIAVITARAEGLVKTDVPEVSKIIMLQEAADRSKDVRSQTENRASSQDRYW